MTVETNVRVKMRDGVSLVADIYRPKAEGLGSTVFQAISSVVNPDVTSLPVGAAVLYAAVAWGRSPFALLVLPLAGWAAVSFKLTNVLVVGVACGYLLLAALLRCWRAPPC